MKDLLNKSLWGRAFIRVTHTITWSNNHIAPESFYGQEQALGLLCPTLVCFPETVTIFLFKEVSLYFLISQIKLAVA